MLTHGVLVVEVLGMLADFFPLELRPRGHPCRTTDPRLGPRLAGVHRQGLQPGDPVADRLRRRRFLELVERHRVNALFLVPTMVKMIVHHPDVDRRDLSSLRWVFYGGSPMYVDDLRRAHQQARQHLHPGVRPDRVADDGHRAAGIGTRPRRPARPSPGVVRTGADRHPGAHPRRATTSQVPTGEIGEICIRGGTVMKGYWQRPEETAETLRNGWLHTGDLGRMDDHGYVYILDRSKDMVISGGLNVYPREIEEVMLTHPDDLEACVFGVPDEKWGEAVTAHLVLSAGYAPRRGSGAVSTWPIGWRATRSRSGSSSLPSSPKTPYGKIDKKLIRAEYWEGHDRLVG